MMPNSRPATKREMHRLLEPPRPTEQRYRLDLVRLFGAMHTEVQRIVSEHLHSEAPVRKDASKDEPVSPSARIAAVGGVASAKLRKDVASHLRKGGGVAFHRMSEGVHERIATATPSLIAITPESAGIQDYVDDARAEALDYLVQAGADYVDDVQSVLEDEDNFDLPIADLAKLIAGRAKVSNSKALFLATDQTLKLHSGIMRRRHEAAGLDKYTWSTSLDERVRPMHAELEGKTFSYDDPPVTNEAGDVNNPGQDFACRCVAIPQLGDEEEGDEPDDDEGD
jgi:SPP1 gp7 family putative phage head morphogenesis protein